MESGNQEMSKVSHNMYRAGILSDLKGGRITARFDDNGDFHCDDGPAITKATGDGLMWYKHGFLHRLDGPATVMSWATAWWINGELLTSWDHYQKLTNCSSECLVMLKLKWSKSVLGE